MRFLLGAAEAILSRSDSLSALVSRQERAHHCSVATGGVMAGVVGSPISGAILGLNGVLGLAGWQWLFLGSTSSCAHGLGGILLLPNRPQQASWLSASEKTWIQARSHEEAAHTNPQHRHHLKDAFTSGRVWLLCLLYFLLNVGGYG
jgi:ACS family tartrate transporter-like MFS transporter